MGIDTDGTMKHENIQSGAEQALEANREVMRRGLGEDGAYVPDPDRIIPPARQDTVMAADAALSAEYSRRHGQHVGAFEADFTTPAEDAEVDEIEVMARGRTVMFWGGIVRVINRMRKAEARVAELEARDSV